MSNQKLMKAHVMAVALERGERWRVAGDSLFWSIEAATVGRVWNKCVRWMKEAHGSRNRCLRLPGLTIVHGWTELRDFDALKKHGDEIREIFGASGRFGESGKFGKVGLDNRGAKLVGVHVRRTDYREWQGGKYCYPNIVYERIMQELREEMRSVCFAVFTDEPESLSPDLSKLNEQPTTPERDQWLMSQCDYLVGPPSTFTAWASFMGKVPLLHIMDNAQKVRLSDFVMNW